MPERLEDLELQLLLEALYQRYHYDFRHYARASIKRRVVQARDQMGFATLSALQDAVLHDPSMLPRLLGYLTVQVSEMFRDPTYFKALREKVLHYLRTEALPAPGGAVRTPYTRAGLAAYLGCERSALCRELSRMRRDGILQIDGRVFRLLPGVPPRQNGRPVRADREENDGM